MLGTFDTIASVSATRFSVVIPTYNRAKRVAAAVRSVLAQTEKDWECFVVDDGSTDDTKSVLSAFKDPRLKLIFNEKNRGQHACRNQAIRMATSPWIAFLDSDDLFLPERLAAMRQAIEAKPSAGFFFSNAYIWRFDRLVGTLFEPERHLPEGRVPGWYAVGDEHLPYVTSTVVVRKDAFAKTGFFREDLRILEDTELYGRMLAGGLEVAGVGDPLVVRFIHEAQITRDHRKDFEESMEALRASGAPPQEAARVRKKIAREVAEYLWRDLRPAAAREMLEREAPGERGGAYWKTYLPAAALAPLKCARAGWLRLRHHPALASAREREVTRWVRSVL